MKNNSEVHKKRIQSIVDEIMNQDITNAPYDYLFRSNTLNFPETNHQLLGLPGEYVCSENTSLFVQNKNPLEMDYLEKVKFKDNKHFQEALTNVEQETGAIKDEKKGKIIEYAFGSSQQYGKFCFSFVVTNHDYKTDILQYEVNGVKYTIYLIIFNKEKIYKILNTLKEKDYNKDEFTETDLVNFIHCLIFAKKKFAKDVVRKLVKIFTRIKNITEEMQKELSSSLCLMIKYHFTDEKEIRRLLTMITETLPQKQQKKLPFEVRLQNQLAESQKKIANRDNTIAEMGNALDESNNTIAEKDKLIEKEIREKEFFKALLEKNNISYSLD